jgi:subtilisin family serine protease
VRVYQFRHIRADAHCSPPLPPTFGRSRRTIDCLKRLLLVGVCLLVALPALAAARGPAPQQGPLVEVVVELKEPGLAQALGGERRLHLDAPASLRRLTRIAVQQELVEERIRRLVPAARVSWRYKVVLNAIAVLLPPGQVARLDRLEGVREVHRSVQYGPTLDRSVAAINAPGVWGAGLETSGQGIKIAILDDGLDQRHPFFNPAGYAMPPGYPKGNAAYTTAKVIVARAFQPPFPKAQYSDLPLDPERSEHGTHVAGIAAGNAGTQVSLGGGRVTISGVAPRAYLGNYRVLTTPTISNVGLNGNSPQIAAGIEAAVRDGMDVINLSLGEPEIAPGRDLVVRAIEGAAAAGVVSAIAAGNDFALYGTGSVASPGSARSAITAAAASVDRRIAGFSAGGPTPISLLLKPDVAAPGVGILSSVPAREGTWAAFSGTSMAAPHVAGAAALLTQRHPAWTVAQVKSALTLTASPAEVGTFREAATTRQGAGFIDVAKADQPLVFADPAGVSFGFVRRGRAATRAISVTDAGGGAGEWTLSVVRQSSGGGVAVTAPTRMSVPGTLTVRATANASAPQADVTGFLVLGRAGQTRRIPFWLRVTAPQLPRLRARTLSRTGVYRGNTRGRRPMITRYRYPDNPSGIGVERTLAGPEQVFRVRIRRPAENFGVAVLTRSRIQPRIVIGADENHQAGSTALPLQNNPYLPTFLDPAPVAAVIRPEAGTYHVVFDSPTRAGAGRFQFRFWVNDRTPPRVRLATSSIRRGGTLVAVATDAGAGVDPQGIYVQLDGGEFRNTTLRNGRIRIPVGSLGPGRHRLLLQVSDRQEAKNMENSLRILPNTTQLTASFSVR